MPQEKRVSYVSLCRRRWPRCRLSPRTYRQSVCLNHIPALLAMFTGIRNALFGRPAVEDHVRDDLRTSERLRLLVGFQHALQGGAHAEDLRQ